MKKQAEMRHGTPRPQFDREIAIFIAAGIIATLAVSLLKWYA